MSQPVKATSGLWQPGLWLTVRTRAARGIPRGIFGRCSQRRGPEPPAGRGGGTPGGGGRRGGGRQAARQEKTARLQQFAAGESVTEAARPAQHGQHRKPPSLMIRLAMSVV